jgi:hypothetical protein
MNELKIKSGDKLTVTACYFQVPDWMDNQPCVLLSPVLQYTETNSADSAIEDFLISLCVDEECESDNIADVDNALQWVGKSIKSLKRSVNRSIKTGKSPYKSRYSEVVIVDVEIFENGDGELDWKELSRKEINQYNPK